MKKYKQQMKRFFNSLIMASALRATPALHSSARLCVGDGSIKPLSFRADMICAYFTDYAQM